MIRNLSVDKKQVLSKRKAGSGWVRSLLHVPFCLFTRVHSLSPARSDSSRCVAWWFLEGKSPCRFSGTILHGRFPPCFPRCDPPPVSFLLPFTRRASSVPIPHHASPGLCSVSSLGRFSGVISAAILPSRFPGVILRCRSLVTLLRCRFPIMLPGAMFRLVSGQILRCLFRGYSSAVLLQDSAPSRVRPSRDQDQ